MALKEVKKVEPHTTKTGVSLADLLGARRELDVPFPGGLSLSVVYNPAKVVSRLVLIDQEDKGNDADNLRRNLANQLALARAICRVVISWDLADCPDVGPGCEALVADTVPNEILNTVLAAINEDAAINPRQARPTA